MMLHTVIDAYEVFPFDYSGLRVENTVIPYGVRQVTFFPSGQCDTRIISTDLRIYIPKKNKFINGGKQHEYF